MDQMVGDTKEVQEKQMLVKLEEVLKTTSAAEGGLIPVLQTTQSIFGYIPQCAMELIAERMVLPMSTIFGVVTFYSFFSLIPRGKYLIRICLGTACYVLGAQTVLETFRENLGIDVGQTTKDRLFTLDAGRCFGACGLAPVIMVNDNVHQRVKTGDIPGIIQLYRQLALKDSKGGN